jgi:hypothetical protein
MTLRDIRSWPQRRLYPAATSPSGGVFLGRTPFRGGLFWTKRIAVLQFVAESYLKLLKEKALRETHGS